MTNPVHPYYSVERRRLESFRTWPKGLSQKPSVMADAGFFYTGQSDRVICYFCNGKLKDWTPEDQPWKEHARWFKYCSYVLIMKGEEYVQSIGSYKNPVQNRDCDIIIIDDKKLVQPTRRDDRLEAAKIICKICLVEEAKTCFIPCGHVVACEKCSLSIYKKCPICRKLYVDIIRLYF